MQSSSSCFQKTKADLLESQMILFWIWHALEILAP
jgi:hypothetical protein